MKCIIIDENKAKNVRDWDGQIKGGVVEAWHMTSKGKKGAKLDVRGCSWSGNLGYSAARDTVSNQVDYLLGEGNWVEAIGEQYGDTWSAPTSEVA